MSCPSSRQTNVSCDFNSNQAYLSERTKSCKNAEIPWNSVLLTVSESGYYIVDDLFTRDGFLIFLSVH